MPNWKEIFRASKASRRFPSLSITVVYVSQARPLVGRCSRRSHTSVLAMDCSGDVQGRKEGEGVQVEVEIEVGVRVGAEVVWSARKV